MENGMEYYDIQLILTRNRNGFVTRGRYTGGFLTQTNLISNSLKSSLPYLFPLITWLQLGRVCLIQLRCLAGPSPS